MFDSADFASKSGVDAVDDAEDGVGSSEADASADESFPGDKDDAESSSESGRDDEFLDESK